MQGWAGYVENVDFYTDKIVMENVCQILSKRAFSHIFITFTREMRK